MSTFDTQSLSRYERRIARNGVVPSSTNPTETNRKETIMETINVTAAQAKRELKRRARPKGDPKRAKYPAKHIMDLSGEQLREIAASTSTKPVVEIVVEPTAAEVSKLITRVAEAKAALSSEAGFVKRVIAERKRLLSLADVDAQIAEAERVLAEVEATR